MINRCILQYIKYPHTYSFFVLEKESMQTESETNKYPGQKLYYLLKSKLVLAAIASILVHLNPNPVPSPYHASLVQVRSIYLGSHTRSYSSSNPASSL